MYEVEAAAPLLDILKNVLQVGDKGFDIDALCQRSLVQAAWRPSRRDRAMLPFGITEAFIVSGTKSKKFSNV